MNKSKGFTLIELIIVIILIAVLAVMVIISIQGYIKKSKDATSKGEIQSLMISANFYANNHLSGKYDPAYFTCVTEKTWLNILAKDSTAVCGTNTNVGANQYDNFCACFKEASPTTATYYCQDSTGAITEQVLRTCANECKLSGTAICGQN
ncbi:MAG: prepilin-type N-terminal cleavage/methylation domain-containing protein [Candidatus Staskawiczbacteria bacterium]